MPTLALNFFERLGRARFPAWGWLVLLWAALIFPAIWLRAFHYEEGTVIAIARGAFEDGFWLVPHNYGARFVERPVLMSWIIAILGWCSGEIGQSTARIPAVFALLGGAAFVFYLVRQKASALAALFGALCVMLCPAMLQKLVTAEPDMLVSVLLFAAFVVWWDGHKTGALSYPRWVAVGLLLALAAMTKGPQPVAYFSFGVGVFILLRAQWREIPGFALAHIVAGLPLLAWYGAIYRPGDFAIWAEQGRLHTWFGLAEWFRGLAHYLAQVALENLPALILAVPLAVVGWRERKSGAVDLILALVCYALVTTIIVGLFPGRGARYAMPAVLATAALAGLAYDRYRGLLPRLVDIAVGVAFLLAGYALVLNWIVMPLKPELFQKSFIAAQTMRAQMRDNPATLYATFETQNNGVFAYLPPPIRMATTAELAQLHQRAFAYLSPEEVADVLRRAPQMKVTQRAIIHADTDADLYEIEP